MARKKRKRLTRRHRRRAKLAIKNPKAVRSHAHRNKAGKGAAAKSGIGMRRKG